MSHGLPLLSGEKPQTLTPTFKARAGETSRLKEAEVDTNIPVKKPRERR